MIISMSNISKVLCTYVYIHIYTYETGRKCAFLKNTSNLLKVDIVLLLN